MPPRRALAARAGARDRRAQPVRRLARRVRATRARRRRLRPDHAGARARRLRPAQLGLGAELAGDVPDLRLRHPGAEGPLAARARLGQGDRLLRPDRARLRLEPGGHAHHRAARRVVAGSSTAPSSGSPTARSPTSPWSGRAPTRASTAFLVERGTPGFTSAEQHGKFSLRASITSELGFLDCRIPAENLLPGADGLKAALDTPQPGALRHRLGRHRLGDGDLLPARSSTPRSASSSAASRSPATSWCRRSWCGW